MVKLDSAQKKLRRSPRFREWMAPIVGNVRAGLKRKIVGYRTAARGEPRVRVTTQVFTRCVSVDFVYGDQFNYAHYWHILFGTFVERHLGHGISGALQEAGFGYHQEYLDWWHPAIVATIEEEVGEVTVQRVCERIFDAAKLAMNDEEFETERKSLARYRTIQGFKNTARDLIKIGFTKEQMSELVGKAIEEVQCPKMP